MAGAVLYDGGETAAGHGSAGPETTARARHWPAMYESPQMRRLQSDLLAMERLVAMGMIEGLRSAMGQLDRVLTEPATGAASRATVA